MRMLHHCIVVATIALASQASSARAQFDYPGGFGGMGWGGWGMMGNFVGTVEGEGARGLGMLAMGEGFYNKQTAQANAINADTLIKWNQYWWESQVEANRAQRERQLRRQASTNVTLEQLNKRLRDNPEPRDIHRGSALNVAVEEINDPRVYIKALSAAKVKVGGDLIRDIPFQYAAGAVTKSIQQLSQGPPPAALKTPQFESQMAELKALGDEIRKQLDDEDKPDAATVSKALALINEIEAKVETVLPRNSRDRVTVDRYLKGLHGLIAMLKTPALDIILAGVDKRPEATLGELLRFMNAFNLRFGIATTPRQRQVYDALYPRLVTLRNEVAPTVATSSTPKSSGTEVGDFFSAMSYDDLKKKAPAPTAKP